ncbi:MAG: hypothetical protein WDZ62_00035 [Candidatus Pacearchaeota archaeon]
MIENKFDQHIKDRKTETINIDLSEIGKGIKEFLKQTLKSKEIAKLAPTDNGWGSYRGPLFYASKKEILNEILKDKSNFHNFGKKGILYSGYLFEPFSGILPGGHNCSYNRGALKFRLDKFKVNREEHISVSEVGINSAKIFSKEMNSDLEKVSKILQPLYMVDAGDTYNPKLNKLERNIGNKIKKIDKTSLENCLVNYFINPLLKT